MSCYERRALLVLAAGRVMCKAENTGRSSLTCTRAALERIGKRFRPALSTYLLGEERYRLPHSDVGQMVGEQNLDIDNAG